VSDEPQFDVADWQAFLRDWDAQARELLPRLDAWNDPVTKEFNVRGSILLEGATEEAIGAGARKLGLELPESLKRFFRASNGLIVPMLDAEHARIVAAEQLTFLRDNESWIVLDREADRIDVPDDEYRRYGRAQNPLGVPSKYYRGLVQLCPMVDSALLAMNPQVCTPGGEWEAWHMRFAAPGTFRYPHFEAMMVELRNQSMSRLREIAH
jgi:hypothetical protein